MLQERRLDEEVFYLFKCRLFCYAFVVLSVFGYIRLPVAAITDECTLMITRYRKDRLGGVQYVMSVMNLRMRVSECGRTGVPLHVTR